MDDKPAAKLPEWKDYFMPAMMTKILHKKFGMFGAIVGFYYLVQFICCVAACNFYSDAAREQICVLPNGVALTAEESSAVFDTAIKLGGVFHIMEWIRTTILLTVICVGVNLTQVWYFTSVTALYGLGTFIYVIVVFASEKGQACMEPQIYRYQWLMSEIIIFFTLFFIYQVPILLVRCFSKQKLHEILNAESEDED